MKKFLRIMAALTVLLLSVPVMGAGPPSVLEGGVQTIPGPLRITGDLTVDGSLSGGAPTFTGDVTLPPLTTGSNSPSYKIVMEAFQLSGTVTHTGSIYTLYDGLISYVVFSAPDASGVETPVLGMSHDTYFFATDDVVSIGMSGMYRPKNIWMTGNLNSSAGGVVVEQSITSVSGNIQATTGWINAGGDLIVNGGEIGLTGDLDLMQIASASLTVNGATTVGNAGTDTDSYKLMVEGDASATPVQGGMYIDINNEELIIGAPDSGDQTFRSSLRVNPGYIEFPPPDDTANVDSLQLVFHATNSSTDQQGFLQVMNAANPYLAIEAPDDSGTPQLILQIYDNEILVNGGITFLERYDDLRVPLTTAPPGPGNNPGFDVFLGAVRQYAFDPDTEEELFFTAQLKHSYKYGTDLHAHLHWSPKTTDTGNAKWCIEYTLAEMDGTYPAPTTICGIDAGDGTAYKHQYIDLGDIDGSAIDTLSATIAGRIYRDADDGVNDTFTGDAYGIELDFHFEMDTMGSATELTK